MSGYWYIYFDSDEVGPLSEKEIASLVAKGQVDAETLVFRDGYDAWYPLHSTEIGHVLSPSMLVHEATMTDGDSNDAETLGEKLKSGVQNRGKDFDIEPPFPAYQGTEPYIFVSYAHKDSALVFKQIASLHAEGFRIWYDEGIDPGNEWPEEIAKALGSCALFLLYVTPRSVASVNCRNEINFALNKSKPFLSVYLEETELPDGLALRMGDLQAIMMHSLSPDLAYPKLFNAIEKNISKAQLEENEKQNRLATAQKIARQSVNQTKRKSKKPLYLTLGAIAVALFIVAGLMQNSGKESEIRKSKETEDAALARVKNEVSKEKKALAEMRDKDSKQNAEKIAKALAKIKSKEKAIQELSDKISQQTQQTLSKLKEQEESKSAFKKSLGEAYTHYANGEINTAKSILDTLYAKDQSDPKLLRLQGAIAFIELRTDDALAKFDKMVEADKTSLSIAKQYRKLIKKYGIKNGNLSDPDAYALFDELKGTIDHAPFAIAQKIYNRLESQYYRETIQRLRTKALDIIKLGELSTNDLVKKQAKEARHRIENKSLRSDAWDTDETFTEEKRKEISSFLAFHRVLAGVYPQSDIESFKRATSYASSNDYKKAYQSLSGASTGPMDYHPEALFFLASEAESQTNQAKQKLALAGLFLAAQRIANRSPNPEAAYQALKIVGEQEELKTYAKEVVNQLNIRDNQKTQMFSAMDRSAEIDPIEVYRWYGKDTRAYFWMLGRKIAQGTAPPEFLDRILEGTKNPMTQEAAFDGLGVSATGYPKYSAKALEMIEKSIRNGNPKTLKSSTHALVMAACGAGQMDANEEAGRVLVQLALSKELSVKDMFLNELEQKDPKANEAPYVNNLISAINKGKEKDLTSYKKPFVETRENSIDDVLGTPGDTAKSARLALTVRAGFEKLDSQDYSVYVDGNRIPPRPKTEVYDLPAQKEIEFRITAEGYEDDLRSFTAPAGQEAALTVTLRRKAR